MSMKLTQAVFHIALGGGKIHTRIEGKYTDLIKCVCVAMEEYDSIAELITGAADVWKEYCQQRKENKETVNP